MCSLLQWDGVMTSLHVKNVSPSLSGMDASGAKVFGGLEREAKISQLGDSQWSRQGRWAHCRLRLVFESFNQTG